MSENEVATAAPASEADLNRVITESTTAIVAAYLTTNQVPVESLDGVFEKVRVIVDKSVRGVPDVPPPQPAVPVKKSITDEYLICLEDGKKFKSLKRHLRTQYNMTPDEYRKKWNLAADYPMVAPGYSEHRSSLAKNIGLGQMRKAAAKPVEEVEDAEVVAEDEAVEGEE